MRTVEFKPDGILVAQTYTYEQNGVEKISQNGILTRWEDAQIIADAVELHHAIDDVKTHLSEAADGVGTEENEDGYVFDRTMFSEDVIRVIAEMVVDRKGNCDSIGEAYNQIVDEAIDECVTSYNAEYEIYEKGDEDGELVEVKVYDYDSVEALKAETEEVVRGTCREYKVAGDEVTVKLTITTASGTYHDSDEFTVSIAGEGAAE